MTGKKPRRCPTRQLRWQRRNPLRPSRAAVPAALRPVLVLLQVVPPLDLLVLLVQALQLVAELGDLIAGKKMNRIQSNDRVLDRL